MKPTCYNTLLSGLISVLMVACGGGGASTDATAPSAPVSEARLIEIEDKIVSTFENSTTDIQYAFIANINDGRGYTAGRAGFTSATGDMLQVVLAYSVLVPGNVLAKYIPALQKVNGTASVVGLNGIVLAWQTAAKDPQFIAVQDSVNNSLYRQPARQLAESLSATLPLTKLALYEAGIQHGYGAYYDSVNQIVERASVAAGGNPGNGVDETKWLQAFLTERRKDLLNPGDKTAAALLALSVSRADAMLSIYAKGNFNLDKTITYTVYGASFTI